MTDAKGENWRLIKRQTFKTFPSSLLSSLPLQSTVCRHEQLWAQIKSLICLHAEPSLGYSTSGRLSRPPCFGGPRASLQGWLGGGQLQPASWLCTKTQWEAGGCRQDPSFAMGPALTRDGSTYMWAQADSKIPRVGCAKELSVSLILFPLKSVIKLPLPSVEVVSVKLSNLEWHLQITRVRNCEVKKIDREETG